MNVCLCVYVHAQCVCACVCVHACMVCACVCVHALWCVCVDSSVTNVSWMWSWVKHMNTDVGILWFLVLNTGAY